MGQVYWGGLLAVAVMYAAFLVVGWLASRKVRQASAEELILAGRAMPLWIATMTMTATWVDGGYLLGTAEGAFKPDGGLASGLQGGVCFGISLFLGGLFFAKKMRRLGYMTLIDPFEARFGKKWAAVLALPAMFGELIWSAELLAAIGGTFSVILGMDLVPAILLSAGIVTLYTVVGGMWSVAYTDAFQLALIPLGMLAALPFALGQVGGLDTCLTQYLGRRAQAPAWTPQQFAGWWDVSIMLVLGGIPWNCYFQRVLACRTPVTARWHSIWAGVLTILLTVPPLLLGMAAYTYAWPAPLAERLTADAQLALPFLLRYLVPYWIGVLGLGAIIGAVTSSFSASILSAGSMFSWNVYRRLLFPAAGVGAMRLVIRGSVLLLGVGAVLLALRVQSVQQLWFFTSDLVFVLLVPQLIYALFDPKANLAGSVAAFAVALVLRLGGGEPTFDLDPFIPYPELFGPLWGGDPKAWYDGKVMLFPFKTLAFAVGMVLLPVVSRLTARWQAPRPLEAPLVKERNE